MAILWQLQGLYGQWRNEPKHLGGHNLLRGSEATKPEGA